MSPYDSENNNIDDYIKDHSSVGTSSISTLTPLNIVLATVLVIFLFSYL